MSRNHSVIAFASCNRQFESQSHWEVIDKYRPSYFLWTGDAVYGGSHDVSSLEGAYKNLTDNIEYSKFRDSGVIIDGIWDDHDYGVNDAGKHAKQFKPRQNAYVEFISSPANDIRHLAQRRSLHHDLNLEANGLQVKVLFLDTRSNRDNHFVKSMGEVHFPLTAILASAIRGAYSVMGIGRNYKGEVLGETQWKWLEQQLTESTADVHIVVSSIQVLTSNPVVESWGHFPREKQRLFDLFQQTNPNGLILLSGDVHLGELSQAHYQRANGDVGQWVEVTSSGLTHTAADNVVTSRLCPLMMWMFDDHRNTPDSYYLGRNFGTIEVSDANKLGEKTVTVSVRSLEAAELSSAVLSHTLTVPATGFAGVKQSPVVSVDVPDFYLLPMAARLPLAIFLFLMLCGGFSHFMKRAFPKMPKNPKAKGKRD